MKEEVTFEQFILTWRTEKKSWALLKRLAFYSGMIVAILKLFCMYSVMEQLLETRDLVVRKGRYKYRMGEGK